MDDLLIQLKKEVCQDNNDRLSNIVNEIERRLTLAEKIEKTLYDSELYLVYKHTSPDGKVYIGITQNHPQTRWNEGGGYEKQTRFYKAIQKYGWVNFKHEIIDAGLTEKEAKDIENEQIIICKSYLKEYGYNTRVILDEVPKEENVKKKRTSKVKKEEIDYFDIAQKLIEKYDIKTVNEQIYYKREKTYVNETDYPILRKNILILGDDPSFAFAVYEPGCEKYS